MFQTLLRTTVTIILLSMSIAFAQPKNIFAVSDIYGIRPDGTAQEIKSGDFGEFRKKNVHWDAASKTIRMYGARNEEVAVQVVIPQTAAAVRATASAFNGKGNISAERSTFSIVAWVNQQKLGYCPDLIIPLDGSYKEVSSFSIPLNIAQLPAPNNSVGVLLYELWIPANATAGDYRGEITIYDGQKTLETLKVQLTVFDFELPRQPSLSFELLSYGVPSKYFIRNDVINPKPGLGHPARKLSARAKAIDHQVFKMALDNRCFVNPLPYSSQRGWGNYALPVKGVGKNAQISSYAEWEDLFGPLLDGKLNKFGVAPAHLLLPFNINYPYLSESDVALHFDFTPFKTSPPRRASTEPALAEFEATYTTIAKQYVRWFKEKGWTDTIFEVFFNQKPNPDRNRTPWKLDEPVNGRDYAGIRYLFAVSDKAFESAKGANIRVRNRLDVGHFNCDRLETPSGNSTRCYKRKGYNRDNADRYLKPSIQHWVIGTTHVEATTGILDEYRSRDAKLLNYGSSGTTTAIGGHYGFFAGEGFRAFRLGIDGRVIFKLGLGNTNPNKLLPGPYKGGALYSGRELGFDGALASHRLKLWRRGVNDYDYLLKASKVQREKTKKIAGKMVKPGPATNPKYREQSNSKGFWITNNVEDMLRARLLLAELITGKAYGAGSLEGFSEFYTPCGTADQIVGYD